MFVEIYLLSYKQFKFILEKMNWRYIKDKIVFVLKNLSILKNSTNILYYSNLIILIIIIIIFQIITDKTSFKGTTRSQYTIKSIH